MQLKEEYNPLRAEKKPPEKAINDIKKDVRRTFSKHETLSQDIARQGIQSLLEALSLKYPEIGYVQGMNFIAGACYYHADLYYSYGLIITLFEMLEMRDIFLPSKSSNSENFVS